MGVCKVWTSSKQGFPFPFLKLGMPAFKFQPLKHPRGVSLVIPLSERKKSCSCDCVVCKWEQKALSCCYTASRDNRSLSTQSNAQTGKKNKFVFHFKPCLSPAKLLLQMRGKSMRILPKYGQRFQKMGLSLNYFSPLWGDPIQFDESSTQKLMDRKRTAGGCKHTATFSMWVQNHALQTGTIRSNYTHLGSCPLKSKFRSIDFGYRELEEAASGSEQQLHADCWNIQFPSYEAFWNILNVSTVLTKHSHQGVLWILATLFNLIPEAKNLLLFSAETRWQPRRKCLATGETENLTFL